MSIQCNVTSRRDDTRLSLNRNTMEVIGHYEKDVPSRAK